MTCNPHTPMRPPPAARAAALVAALAAIVPGVSLLAGAAQAQEPRPPEALTWMVLNEINGAYFDRLEPMNRPPLVTQVPQGMIRAVNVSADGSPDWLIDYADQGAMWCGTGGCLKTLYVSDGDDYVMAFDAQVLALDIDTTGRVPVLQATVHALYCGEDQTECSLGYAWDAGARQLIERPNRQGLTRISGDFDPLANSADVRLPDSLPPELNALWFGLRSTCQDFSDDGFEVRRPGFRSIPDVNGDGRRDWIVTDTERCQSPNDETEAPLPAYTVWVSDADALTEAYHSPTNVWPHLEIAQSPAQIIEVPPCGIGEPCLGTPLRWNESAGQLQKVD